MRQLMSHAYENQMNPIYISLSNLLDQSSTGTMKTLVLASLLVSSVYGFRYGAPISACTDMFPTIHGYNARTDTPPFTITVSKNTYKGGDSISVFVDAQDTDPDDPTKEFFMEGILIMARKAKTSDAGCPTDPVGTWEVDECDDFLQVIDCFPKRLDKSAVRHYTHIHCYNKTLTWKAPAEAVGHVYIVATIARNKSRFWMNVQSEPIKDPTTPGAVTEVCPALKTIYVDPNKTSAATNVYASALTILLALIRILIA